MYDKARYLFNVHYRTLSIQRKRSIYVSSIHGKYLLCPYIFYLFIKKYYFFLSSFLICRVKVLDTDRINVETKDHHYIY